MASVVSNSISKIYIYRSRIRTRFDPYLERRRKKTNETGREKNDAISIPPILILTYVPRALLSSQTIDRFLRFFPRFPRNDLPFFPYCSFFFSSFFANFGGSRVHSSKHLLYRRSRFRFPLREFAASHNGRQISTDRRVRLKDYLQ